MANMIKFRRVSNFAKRIRRVAAATTTSVALFGSVAGLHTHAQAQEPTIPDVVVTAVDRDGEAEVRFYSDLVKGKKVVINVMYTDCTTTCSTFAKVLEKEMNRVGGKFGRDVFFVTISIDPLADNPERLRSWADRFGARKGWTFVTATEAQLQDLQSVLRWLRFPTSRVMHSPDILSLTTREASGGTPIHSGRT